MKKRIISILLTMLILTTNFVFAVGSFSDVSDSHWAYSYIDGIRRYNISNCYPDGTFQPERKVTAGELIKMLSLVTWGELKNTTPNSDEHWATPYAKSLINICYNAEYRYVTSPSSLDEVVNRRDAVKMIAEVCLTKRAARGKTSAYEPGLNYIKKYTDLSYDMEFRRCLDICTQFGLINGFEDGTFREEETLTRAQITKIVYLILQDK